MADVKISQLPEVTSLSPSDVLPSVASSVTSKITVQSLASTLPEVSSSISASYALTASYLSNYIEPFPYTGSAQITGSLGVTGSISITQNITASNALFTGAITAQKLVVQTISSSVIYSSGSNIFGDELTDIQQFTGSVRITGSLGVTGSFSTTQDIIVNNNIRIGRGAGNLASNIVIGSGSLCCITNGISNTSIGHRSLTNNTSGFGNVAIGYAVACSNTTGFNNVVIGYCTFHRNIAGARNISVGANTMYCNTYGGCNVAIGNYSLGRNTTGCSNVAIGVCALNSNTTGKGSVAVGNGAIRLNGGSCNTAVGAYALARVSGAKNTALGYSALGGGSGVYGNNNVGVGFQAGRCFRGSNNVILGGLSGSGAITGSNNSIFIADGEGRLQLFITGSTNLATFTGPVSSSAFTGSLFGTSSWAISSSFSLTASYAINAAGVSTFQIATGSVTASVSVGSTPFQLTSASISLLAIDRAGTVTASRAFLSSSNGTASGSTLVVYGSGSSQPVFTVQGSQGELFSVSDSLSGSLFSVNDVSGLPIIEAFSDNRVLIGSYQAPALFTTVRTTSTAGANVIYSVPTASYDAVFFEYSLRSGSNARAGQIMSIWSGSDTNWTETVTADFGNTTAVTFRTIITGSSLALTGSFPSASWTMKTIIRGI